MGASIAPHQLRHCCAPPSRDRWQRRTVRAPIPPRHHQTHQTPRPRSSTREFDVSLDCVRLSGLTLRCPDSACPGRVSTTFLCSTASHARTTTCAHPNDSGLLWLSPLGGVSEPKSGFGAVLKSRFFGGARVSRFSGACSGPNHPAAVLFVMFVFHIHLIN